MSNGITVTVASEESVYSSFPNEEIKIGDRSITEGGGVLEGKQRFWDRTYIVCAPSALRSGRLIVLAAKPSP